MSTAELDLLVALALGEGAFAARLTGAGFGGSVVALVDVEQAGAVGTRVVERYRAESGLPGTAHLCEAVAGALLPVTPSAARSRSAASSGVMSRWGSARSS